MAGENNRTLILVTNDDGYKAAGLKTLVEVAQGYVDVVVISAEEPMSGMSHAITIKTPLRPRLVEERQGFRSYIVNGTPVDGVKLDGLVRPWNNRGSFLLNILLAARLAEYE